MLSADMAPKVNGVPLVNALVLVGQIVSVSLFSLRAPHAAPRRGARRALPALLRPPNGTAKWLCRSVSSSPRRCRPWSRADACQSQAARAELREACAGALKRTTLSVIWNSKSWRQARRVRHEAPQTAVQVPERCLIPLISVRPVPIPPLTFRQCK